MELIARKILGGVILILTLIFVVTYVRWADCGFAKGYFWKNLWPATKSVLWVVLVSFAFAIGTILIIA